MELFQRKSLMRDNLINYGRYLERYGLEDTYKNYAEFLVTLDYKATIEKIKENVSGLIGLRDLRSKEEYVVSSKDLEIKDGIISYENESFKIVTFVDKVGYCLINDYIELGSI